MSVPSIYGSRELAKSIGLRHDDFVVLLERNRGALEKHGELQFRVSCEPGKMPVRHVVLNEHQALFMKALLLEERALQSSMSRLSRGAMPVDRVAARVAFFKGEEVALSTPSARDACTMTNPPRQQMRPIDCADYAGARRGRMTALFWFSGKNTWVAKCDCGRYEFRHPSRWAEHPCTEDEPDCCSYCVRSLTLKKGGNSHERMPERLMAWIKTLQKRGLTDDEICAVRQIGTLHTVGKCADAIRAEIAAAREAGL